MGEHFQSIADIIKLWNNITSFERLKDLSGCSVESNGDWQVGGGQRSGSETRTKLEMISRRLEQRRYSFAWSLRINRKVISTNNEYLDLHLA